LLPSIKWATNYQATNAKIKQKYQRPNPRKRRELGNSSLDKRKQELTQM